MRSAVLELSLDKASVVGQRAADEPVAPSAQYCAVLCPFRVPDLLSCPSWRSLRRSSVMRASWRDARTWNLGEAWLLMTCRRQRQTSSGDAGRGRALGFGFVHPTCYHSINLLHLFVVTHNVNQFLVVEGAWGMLLETRPLRGKQATGISTSH